MRDLKITTTAKRQGIRTYDEDEDLQMDAQEVLLIGTRLI